MLSDGQQSGSNFFESFADLIFATMAIFVLLFVTILVLLQEGRIKPLSLELTVAIDGSGSMGTEMETLKLVLAEIEDRVGPVAQSFKLGLVIYRAPVNTAVFPTLLQDEKCSVDIDQKLFRLHDADSRGCLSDFYRNNLLPVQGAADLQHGLSQSLNLMRGREPEEGLRRLLVVIGDRGPYERAEGMIPRDQWPAQNSAALGLIRQLQQDDADVRVLFVFTRSNLSFAEDRDFFMSTSAIRGTKYLEGVESLVDEVLLAVLDLNGNKS